MKKITADFLARSERRKNMKNENDQEWLEGIEAAMEKDKLHQIMGLTGGSNSRRPTPQKMAQYRIKLDLHQGILTLSTRADVASVKITLTKNDDPGEYAPVSYHDFHDDLLQDDLGAFVVAGQFPSYESELRLDTISQLAFDLIMGKGAAEVFMYRCAEAGNGVYISLHERAEKD